MLHKEMLLCGGGKKIWKLLVGQSGNYFGTRGNGYITPNTFEGHEISMLATDNSKFYAQGTYIILNYQKPYSSIKITRLDNNKSVTCSWQSGSEYYTNTGNKSFFGSGDVGKIVPLLIEGV